MNIVDIIRVPRLIQALTITGMQADTAKNGDLIILLSLEGMNDFSPINTMISVFFILGG